MEKNEFTEKHCVKVKKIKFGPGEITYTDDAVIVEVGASKTILSKDKITIKSPKIIMEELKKD